MNIFDRTFITIFFTLSTTISWAQSGGVAYFDAPTESYVEIGASDSTNCFSDLDKVDELTVTMWVKWDDKNADNVGNWATRLTFADSSGKGDNGTFWCQHNNKNRYFDFAVQTTNGRDNILSSTKAKEGQWYHVGQVYDGKQMRIYVDGVQENTMAKSGNLNVSSASKLSMGRWPNKKNNYRFFDGNMDEVSVWSRALSKQEINDMMSNPESVTGTNYDTTGLIGYWDFDDYTADDKSPCNNDGTGNGSFSTVPSGGDVTRTTSPGDCSDSSNWDNGVPNDTMTAVVEDSMYLSQKLKTKDLVLKDNLNCNGDTVVIKGGDLIHEGVLMTSSGGLIEFNGSTTSTRQIYAKRPLTVDRLEVDVPSEVDLDSGTLKLRKELKVKTGTLNVASKKLTLLSDSNGTARIAPLPSNTMIKGQVAVQRWIPSGNAGWIDMAPPNKDSVTLAEWDDDLYLSGKKSGGFKDGCAYSGGCFWSVKRSDASGNLVDVTSTSTSLGNGRGYELFIGDNGGINTMSSDTTVTVKGTIKGPGSFTIDVNDTTWSLVANPFASPIDFDQVGLNNVDPSYYVAAATGSYEWYDRSSGSSSHSKVGPIIASSQGFWVKGNGSNAHISLEQSYKSSTSASYSKRFEQKGFHLRLTDGSNGLSSGISLLPSSDHKEIQEVDHKATPVLGAPDLYTLDSSQEAVRSMALQGEKDKKLIPLRVVPEEQGPYTFQAKVPQGMPYEKVYLIDSAQGKRYDLSKGMAQVRLSSSDSGRSRFYLEFTNDPVSISPRGKGSAEAISVRAEGNSILLKGPIKGGDFNVSVYDARGKKVHPVKQMQFNGMEERSIDGFKKGVYFVRLIGRSESRTKKVLVRGSR